MWLGNDDNYGNFTSSTWLTVSTLNKIKLILGDEILFPNGKDHWSLNITFGGTPDLPVVMISSYDYQLQSEPARLFINAINDSAIVITNVGSIEIHSMAILGLLHFMIYKVME